MDPLARFKSWYDEAVNAELKVPNAIALATASSDGCPSVRYVLLKDIDSRGCVFFTNYASRKGRELEENPQAALCIFWEPLDRQVRLVGDIERLEESQSLNYFQTRPRGSQIAAWASSQSRVLDSREELMQKFQECEAKFGSEAISLPEFWGGYRLVPKEIEFWRGAEHRLHIREQYRREGGEWRMRLLSP